MVCVFMYISCDMWIIPRIDLARLWRLQELNLLIIKSHSYLPLLTKGWIRPEALWHRDLALTLIRFSPTANIFLRNYKG